MFCFHVIHGPRATAVGSSVIELQYRMYVAPNLLLRGQQDSTLCFVGSKCIQIHIQPLRCGCSHSLKQPTQTFILVARTLSFLGCIDRWMRRQGFCPIFGPTIYIAIVISSSDLGVSCSERDHRCHGVYSVTLHVQLMQTMTYRFTNCHICHRHIRYRQRPRVSEYVKLCITRRVVTSCYPEVKVVYGDRSHSSGRWSAENVCCRQLLGVYDRLSGFGYICCLILLFSPEKKNQTLQLLERK